MNFRIEFWETFLQSSDLDCEIWLFFKALLGQFPIWSITTFVSLHKMYIETRRRKLKFPFSSFLSNSFLLCSLHFPLNLNCRTNWRREEPTHSEDSNSRSSSSLTPLHGGDCEGGDEKWKENDYEVFLSFEEKDTRKGFTDHLYTSLIDAGIHVFRDDNELRVGEEIGPELLHGITRSKILIPIISEDYASSKWCLCELTHMLKCMRNRGQTVLPIFYKVEPSKLRHLIGRFADAINAHKKNLDEMVVKEWEDALREVSSLKGWVLEKIDNGYEGTLVKMVVRKVMSELKRTSQLIVPKDLVGIANHVEEIMSFINAKFNDTMIIGIYGIGGVGKTTLAKVLYNNLSDHFEHLSFMADIRETSLRKGIECLQKQLIYDVLRYSLDVSSVYEGIGVIRSRFTSKKVLILLDDVDDVVQVNALVGDGSWFKAGSIVIITTRNDSIFVKVKANYMYRLNELPYDRSLILFRRHAFRADSPQSDYEDISSEVVLATGGVPLFLEVIGSFLCGKRKEIWANTTNKLTVSQVQKILRISYDALNYGEQQIFLDIACLFVGSSGQSPTYMWDAHGFFPENGIEVLSLMSLIKIDEYGNLMMHDQLRDLGREIVRQECLKEPHMRSRLWIYEEAIDVLDNNKGTSKIETLRLDKYGSTSYTSEQFKELTNLRFLHVKAANLEGDFQNLLPQLRWLWWEDCPLDFRAANFHLKNLVVLYLPRSRISEDWNGWASLMMAMKLKVLNLSHCHCLRRTPPLFTFKNLEILILEYCYNLERIDSSIEVNKTLISLNVRGCYRLKELPEEVGGMKELRELLLDGTCIRKIPMWGGGLMKLESLCASRCKFLEELPYDIGKLVSLNKLDLDESGIWHLPESISRLSSLQYLGVRFCEELQELPELPSGLITLGITCQSQSLPHLSQLALLKEFTLSDCRWLRYLPELPIGLSKLSITSCGKLEALTNLSNLKHLSELILEECFELREVTGLEGLQSLSRLHVRQCPKISGLDGVESMKSLRDLHIDKANGDSSKLTSPKAAQLEGLPDLSTSKVLQETYDASCVKESHPETTPLKMQREVSGPRILLPRESMEKMLDEATWRAADKETSDGNYAIAAVKNEVGIDDRVKQITDLLEMEVNDEVRIIGICGTDGIGKTTLAKAVYDGISSCFDSCSFLAEVEETTQNPRGMQTLQTKLIRDILKRDCEGFSFDERIEDFLGIFRDMKVLIVVDDVEKQSHLHDVVGDQLHWFGVGSRIIVTSQNEEILKDYDPVKARIYMVGKLDDGQAFELFSMHAFGMQYCKSGYDGIANCIVNTTVKLPLAVEVVGSFLRGKSIQEWENMEESMNECMTSCQKTTVGLEEMLDICYKELDQQQKDIFLDIACFISGVDARIASYMWPTSYHPSSDCILMPLAKIGENNELQMHRLLRCLGKRIFMQEESQDSSSRRFCTQDMVLKAMNREKGIEDVEACDSCVLTAANFASMRAISFLKLDDAKVSGDFAGAFPSLRWFCWQRVPLEFGAINFVLTELVIFDLSGSKVTEDWGGWRKIKMANLKVLNLTGCSDLLITPDFSGYKNLEILILERCSRLVKLDPSIGHLKRLVSLNLKSCSQLNWLPVEVGGMTALKELFIDGTSVREIPISIGNLKQLKILSGFKCFSLTRLPSSISYLTSLSELSLDGAKISELPSSLGELLNLRCLSLRDCRYMQELPDSIGKMGSSLEELDISATSISKLPNSIRNLQNLRVLRMDSSFIRAFPVEIGNLTKLEELHASWCRSLKGAVPRDIKRLHHLRLLTLGHSGISSLPSEISTISTLHTLDLLQCNEIEVLPELPPSLICLRVSSKRMKAIPLLKDLKDLEELCLSDEDPNECQRPSEQLMPESKVKQLSIWFSRLWNLELLQTQRTENQSFSISFPKLRKLELSLSRIIKLQFVYEPTDIPQLKTLTLSGSSLEEISELPKTLSVLSIRGCSSLKRLPIVQCLTNLSAFELYHSAIKEIEGLEGLKSLKRLDISNCEIQNLNGIALLTSLRNLIVSDCDYLDGLPDLSKLKLLKVLEIRQCKMIHQIEGLEELTSLEKLKISECPAKHLVQVQNVLKPVTAR